MKIAVLVLPFVPTTTALRPAKTIPAAARSESTAERSARGTRPGYAATISRIRRSAAEGTNAVADTRSVQ